MKLDRANDAAVAKAMAHPLRLRILAVFDDPDGPRTPRGIADALEVDLSQVSYHVRTLAQSGLLELIGTTPVRGTVEHTYRARSRSFFSDDAWEQLPTVVKSSIIDDVLRTATADLRAAARHGGFERQDVHLSRTPVIVDDQGFRELADFLTNIAFPMIERVSRESGVRLEQAEHRNAIRAEVILACFEAAPIGAHDPFAPASNGSAQVVASVTADVGRNDGRGDDRELDDAD